MTSVKCPGCFQSYLKETIAMTPEADMKHCLCIVCYYIISISNDAIALPNTEHTYRRKRRQRRHRGKRTTNVNKNTHATYLGSY